MGDGMRSSFQVEEPVESSSTEILYQPTPVAERQEASEWAGVAVEMEQNHRAALQTNTEAIFNMLNNALGVSLLAVSWVCSKIGLIPAMMLYLLSCFLNRYTLLLVFRSCQLSKVKVSYPDVARFCFGSTGFGLVALIMTSQCCITSTAYVVTVGEVLFEVLPLSQRGATIIGMLLLLPFTLIRSLKRIAVLSTVATIACLLELLTIAVPCYWDYFSGVTELQRKMENGKCRIPLTPCDSGCCGEPGSLLWFNLDLTNLAEVLPVILLSYATQSSSPVILASLANDSWENVRKITGFVSMCLYAISAVFGHSVYLRFRDTTTNNALTTIGQRPVDQVARWCGFVLVFISYIFMLFPIRNVLMSVCLQKDELEQEAPYSAYLIMTLALNGVLLSLALIAGELGGLSLCLRFGGGFCATLMAMVVPPMLFVRVRAARGWNVRVVCGSKGGLAAILAIGTSVWISSNFKLVNDIAEKITQKDESTKMLFME